MENYILDDLLRDLNNGYGVYYDYLDNRYLIKKVTENAFSVELITIKEKSPHPKMNIVSLKAIKEVFKFMSNFEYLV